MADRERKVQEQHVKVTGLWNDLSAKELDRIKTLEELETKRKDIEERTKWLDQELKNLDKKEQKYINLVAWEKALKKQEETMKDRIRAEIQAEQMEIERVKVQVEERERKVQAWEAKQAQKKTIEEWERMLEKNRIGLMETEKQMSNWESELKVIFPIEN